MDLQKYLRACLVSSLTLHTDDAWRLCHAAWRGTYSCGFAKVSWGLPGQETLSTAVQCGDGSEHVMLHKRRPCGGVPCESLCTTSRQWKTTSIIFCRQKHSTSPIRRIGAFLDGTHLEEDVQQSRNRESIHPAMATWLVELVEIGRQTVEISLQLSVSAASSWSMPASLADDDIGASSL